MTAQKIMKDDNNDPVKAISANSVQLTPEIATTLFIAELTKQSPVDISTLKNLLKSGADIHAFDKHHWSLLHEAAFQGDTDLFRLCLNNHLNVNTVATYYDTRHSALYYAIRNKHEAAEMILRNNHAVLCIADGYTSQNYDSAQYEGDIVNEERSGKGMILYSNGNSYNGEWKNDKRNGYGTFYWAEGKKYEGDWVKDERNGKGTFTWENGDKYIGDFNHGYRTGQGTYWWANGEIYSGGWFNNKLEGIGTDSLANGDVYIGNFKDGKRSGYGEFYSGGHRIMEHTMGYAVYKGNWENGEKNGQGAYYNRKGKLKTKGTFRNGSIPSGTITLIKTDSSTTHAPANFVFIEPLSLIDVSNGGSFRLGIERRIAHLWSLSGTAGLYFGGRNGWMAKAEAKRYLYIFDNPGRKEYISAEYFYKHDTYPQSDSIIMGNHYLADYTISKYITGIRLKYGVIHTLVRGLTIDSYIGAGIRYRNATSTLTPDQYAHINYETDGGFIYPYSSAISKSIRPDITLGILFGIRY